MLQRCHTVHSSGSRAWRALARQSRRQINRTKRPAAEQEQHTTALPQARPEDTLSSLAEELVQGRLLAPEVLRVPRAPWGPDGLIKVLGAGVVVLTIGIASPLLIQPATATLLAPLGPDLDPLAQAALAHVAREAALLAATVGVLAWALGTALWESPAGDAAARAQPPFSFALATPWLPATLATCCVAFPLADPLLTSLSGWALAHLDAASGGSAGLQDVLGGGGGSAGVADAASGNQLLADHVRECAAAERWGALSLHLLATGLLGPAWEEVFWRGFFLTSLARVLPAGACVAVSSGAFALLHLSPTTAPSILLLAAAGDALYLRSGSLATCLALHALWNSGQLLAVALLGKDAFV